jgi:hypothetical protein
MFRASLVTSFLLVAGGIPATLAQSTLENPVGFYMSYQTGSGVVHNAADTAATAYSEVIEVEGAAWLRLYFSAVALGEGSVIRITSLLDQSSQTLDATGTRMWSETSAYFNGGAVLLELISGAGAIGDEVALSSVALEWQTGRQLDFEDIDTTASPRGSNGQCGICGNDDRTSSSEQWSGRLLPIGCTASVYTTSSCLVTAGHCSSGQAQVIQFNVPASTSNCAIVHPPANDQFPITNRKSRNQGPGNDWGVMTTGTNGLGQRPYDRYGQLRSIATSLANPGNQLDIYGFGADQTCSRYLTQQRSNGSVQTRTSTYYDFQADIRGGNSGSAMMVGNQIAGIVTHCRVGCPNIATRMDRPQFVSARQQLCPGSGLTPPDDDGGLGSDSPLHEVLSNFGHCVGMSTFNSAADLDEDGCVDVFDLELILAETVEIE